MEFLAATLAAVGGLLGSLVGGTIALTRFKRERAFERRLNWMDRLNDGLLEVIDIFDDWSDQLREGGSVDPERWDQQKERVNVISRTLDSHLIYAPNKVLMLLESTERELREAFGHLVDDESPVPSPDELSRLSSSLGKAQRALALAIRREIYPPWWRM